MKKIKIFITSLFFFSFTFADFSDIEYSWYKDAILSLQSQWLANGYGDGRYGTENNITRAEILTILLRASNITIPDAPTEKCFPDVEQTMWYHRYICAAHNLGIANGFESGKFGPNEPVTTLEALAFGNKAMSLGVATNGQVWYEFLQKFSDDNNIMPTHGYTLSTRITRGKSAELITRLQKFKSTNISLSYGSTGCQTGWTLSGENTITIAGVDRKYNLFIPSNYSSSREYSLAIATHGRTNSKDQVQAYMGLQKQNEFIIAYPAALSASNGKIFSWSEKENMIFVDAVLEQVSENYCVNRNQVYAIGHSLGGWMAQRIACLRGEFFSGLAVVGSWPYTGTCSGPVPSLFFQNVDDHLSSYASGINARNTRLKVDECSESTESIQIGPITCLKYNSCSTDNEVVWCEGYTGYGGDPHSWPIGERGSRGYTETGGTWILNYFKSL